MCIHIVVAVVVVVVAVVVVVDGGGGGGGAWWCHNSIHIVAVVYTLLFCCHLFRYGIRLAKGNDRVININIIMNNQFY